jgi:hypothetical protein
MYSPGSTFENTVPSSVPARTRRRKLATVPGAVLPYRPAHTHAHTNTKSITGLARKARMAKLCVAACHPESTPVVAAMYGCHKEVDATSWSTGCCAYMHACVYVCCAVDSAWALPAVLLGGPHTHWHLPSTMRPAGSAWSSGMTLASPSVRSPAVLKDRGAMLTSRNTCKPSGVGQLVRHTHASVLQVVANGSASCMAGVTWGYDALLLNVGVLLEEPSITQPHAVQWLQLNVHSRVMAYAGPRPRLTKFVMGASPLFKALELNPSVACAASSTAGNGPL